MRDASRFRKQIEGRQRTSLELMEFAIHPFGLLRVSTYCSHFGVLRRFIVSLLVPHDQGQQVVSRIV